MIHDVRTTTRGLCDFWIGTDSRQARKIFMNSIFALFSKRDFRRKIYNLFQSFWYIPRSFLRFANRSFKLNKFLDSDFSVHMSAVCVVGNKFNLSYCYTQSRRNFHSRRLIFYELQLIVVGKWRTLSSISLIIVLCRQVKSFVLPMKTFAIGTKVKE